MGKIIVIEAEERLCTAIIAYLKNREVNLITVPSAREATDLLQDHHRSDIDLMILDLKHEDNQGLELLCAIRASPEWANLPVIIISMWNLEPIFYDFLEPGNLLLKPFDMRTLDWMIHNLCSSPTPNISSTPNVSSVQAV